MKKIFDLSLSERFIIHPIVRLISVFIGIPYAVLIFSYPVFFAKELLDYQGSIMRIALLGITIAVINIVGYFPKQKIWRIVLHPFIGWILIISTFLFYIQQ